ncbi:MAG: UbiA family prenyltransferase [Oscillochloris sp.]|nr:UbiA family prenyltransferase [Oscillochloris sp.]
MVADGWHFLRISAIGATLSLPLLGAASSRIPISSRRALGLLGVAACFHSFAYVHNDVCDLELDRGQPLRAQYPLVRGALAPATALRFALVCVPAAFGLDALAVGGSRHGRRRMLGLAFALLAAYNRWGKCCPLPPLTDGLQGLGWAALIGYGALAAGAPTRLVHYLALYEFLLILQVNGVHGALRDLANDASGGARTTAIWLGARIDSAGGLRISRRLTGYAALLHLALMIVAARAVVVNAGEYRPPAQTSAAIGLAALSAGLAVIGKAARNGAAAPDLGMAHLILLLSAPVALAMPAMAPAPRLLLLAAHLLPLAINRMSFDALRGVMAGLRVRPE